MQSTVDYIGENGDIMIVNPFKKEKDARKIFTFNKVFAQNVSQGMYASFLCYFKCLDRYFYDTNKMVVHLAEQIYIDTQPVIRSVLDGFNVCIFAYGQTGSGKTYTMV